MVESDVIEVSKRSTDSSTGERQRLKDLRPLKHTIIDTINISRDEFIKMQREDESLEKYWKLAETIDRDEGKVHFFVRDEILYREYTNQYNDAVEQLMIPQRLRDKTVLYAHETTLSGHMGTASTYKKLITNFLLSWSI